MQVVIFIVFVKKPFARAIGLDTDVGIFFENFRKKRGGHDRGHRALGSPRARCIFALVQRHSLLSLKCFRKHVNTTNDKFGTQRHVNKACNIYLSRIKRAQVLDVPCVGEDPLVLVLDLVHPWSEHLMDDERPLSRW
jgi:hypothetical protein